MGVKMKYKNRDGISLNYAGDDSHKVLVREVIEEAIRILNSHAISIVNLKVGLLIEALVF